MAESAVLCFLHLIAHPHSDSPELNPKLVMSPTQRHPGRGNPAFSMIEMTAVMAIMVILIAAGLNHFSAPASHPGKTDSDMLAGLIDQARTSAITSRSCVVLAVADPDDIPARDPRCNLGIFKIDAVPTDLTETAKGVMITRWRPMEPGIALIGGKLEGTDNPLDAERLTITCETPRHMTFKVHAIAFDSCGKLVYPPGSAPVTLRVARCIYQAGKTVPVRPNPSGSRTEIRMKIGRISARPYRIDG